MLRRVLDAHGVRLAAVATAALAALVAGVLAPARPALAAVPAPIVGSGSTWAANAINNWVSDVVPAGLHVTYNGIGSTTGRAQFAEGVVNFAVSEIPYGVPDGNSFDPPPSRGFAYLPATAGGLAFMYNLSIGGQRVTNLRLSGAVIAGIFTNQITVWNDPRIAADNPGLALPATAITPVVRSDGAGSTAQFTQWMLATQSSSWTAYCQVVGRSPCTATSAYPLQAGTNMVGQQGDTGVSGLVRLPGEDGAIGYTEYAYAKLTGFPVAKVLNAAGYYTAPTAGNVGVSLLNARVNNDPNSPLYLTADLSPVYTDPDPRTYELSYYSYLIVPTDTTFGLSANQGFTLGAFGEYALCQGQQIVDNLGYSALPINLVEAGFAQLQRIPGASVPTATSAILASCDNPTFSPDGTNTLANTDPMPPACDQQGTTQCTAAQTPVATSMFVLASPSPATVGLPVTLTATVTPELLGTSMPTGSVQFEILGGTAIGTSVALNAGVATTTATFETAGTVQVAAVFTPDDAAAFTPSTDTIALTVLPQSVSAVVPVTVTLPVGGSFSLTVDTTDTVTLSVVGSNALAALNPITVTETRNTYPGWSVSGQAADFTGAGTTAGRSIAGDQLGWVPTATALATGATLGGRVTPASPGLGTTAAVLASAPAGSGFGSSTLSANLTLAIPALTMAGQYTSTLTVTAVTALP